MYNLGATDSFLFYIREKELYSIYFLVSKEERQLGSHLRLWLHAFIVKFKLMMIMMVIIPLFQRVSSLLYLNLNLFPCYNPYNRKFLHFVAPQYHCLYRIAQFNLSVTLRVNIKDSCSGSCSSQVIFYLYLGSGQVKCLQTPQSVLHFLSLYDSRSIRSSLL